jgi:DNA modification methylase
MFESHQKLVTLLTGDCRELLKTLPAESVHCCVTSPPYWGLRDYGHPNQIGQEATPEAYVETMRAVFAEVRRVLRADGTLWLNLGDSYASPWPCRRRNALGNGSLPDGRRGNRPPRLGNRIKDKDLIGIPWRLAFALQEDGWYLRSDIIWHKPNAMPESIRDRPTKAHEYLFLFSKSPRYFYDREGIKEPAVTGSKGSSFTDPRDLHLRPNTGRKPRKSVPRGGFDGKTRGFAGREAFRAVVERRNKRTVWTLATHAYRGAHFATYPPELVRPCILAGTSARGCCAQCGAPWERITEKGAVLEEWKKRCGADRMGYYRGLATKKFGAARAQDASAVKARILAGMREVRTVGWRPACACKSSEPIPCTVLDPFAGSGTTGQVALQLGRRALLIELNPDYAALIRDRCTTTPALAFAA